ncbi:hypothetical protein JYT22_01140, partial [Endomicrobium sp. AH-315-J14]|nr:hypothetical protein [Endomicrobium sp. AH-315-J14]
MNRVQSLGNIDSLPYFGPEMGLIGAILTVILWDLFVKDQRKKIYGCVAIALTALAYSAGSSLMFLSKGIEHQNLFNGLLAFDEFGQIFRVLFASVTALILLFITPQSLSSEPGGMRRDAAEMIMLMLVLTLGMNLMASSRNLLMIYLSLEMVSVISFVLAGFKIGDRKSSEGALKYVIYGGVASGVMLYGMSWIYGLTASL